MDAVAFGGGKAGENCGPHSAADFEREPNVFEDGVVDVNGRRLKFAADAQAIDLVFVQAGEISIFAEFDFALCPASCGQ